MASPAARSAVQATGLPGSVHVFQLFAADRRLDLPESFGLEDVVRALNGHVVARARLDGTYENL